MATYEMVIGLEVHVELATKTKIFCGCTTKFGGAPNTHTCPVCTGMPGTLPVANKKVVEFAVAAGLATNCEITRYNKFDRKNYFYPDLPKAYQISQLYLPICRNGHVDIETAAGKKAVGIHEIHMEEDAGKLVHDPWLDETMVDYNRCGVPLLEIVSEPDMRSAEEVIAYLTKLRQTLQYLGVSDCRMQEGSLRADVNLSVRPVGQKEFGTRTEMKNINSFKAIVRAIAGEYRRQVELIEDGGQVKQQTRRWDDNKDASFAMRSKENAQDYRYFPADGDFAGVYRRGARAPAGAGGGEDRPLSAGIRPAGIRRADSDGGKADGRAVRAGGGGLRPGEGGFQLDHGRDDGHDEGKSRSARKPDAFRRRAGRDHLRGGGRAHQPPERAGGLRLCV